MTLAARPKRMTISPAQLVANTNDWAPTDFYKAALVRASTDASRDLTGLLAQPGGRQVVIVNVGSFDLVLKDESASSSAANRFALNGDITLAPDHGCALIYDGTSARWRCVGRYTA